MLHTITVRVGEDDFTQCAQAHAVSIAEAFGSRLKGVFVANPGPGEADPGDEISELVRREADLQVRAFQKRVGGGGVKVGTGVRKEGVVDGLLAESAETDLLVLGMPTEAEAKENDRMDDLFAKDLRLLRKSEASMLLVNKPPNGFGKILVEYRGGIEGKASLRIAGEAAMRLGATVVVHTKESDPAHSARLAAAAGSYYEGFEGLNVESRVEKGVPERETDILTLADEMDVDMIVVGSEPYGLVDRLLGRTTPEQVAKETRRAVMIAR